MSEKRFSRGRKAIIAVLGCIFVACLAVVCWFLLNPNQVTDVLEIPALQTTVETDTASDEQHSEEQAAPADNEAAQDGSSSSSATAEAEANTSTDTTNTSTSQSNEITVHVTIDGSLGGGSVQSSAVSLQAGATVYDALIATGASVNARPTGYGTYVAAINGVAESSGTGWVYAVNGIEPNTTCSNYVLSDGDTMAWTYVNVS